MSKVLSFQLNKGRHLFKKYLHGSFLFYFFLSWYNLGCRYDITVDVAPEVKWVPEDGYKNLKIVVELDSEIDAKTASERELRRRYKSLSTMRIVTNRGLQVHHVLKAPFLTSN